MGDKKRSLYLILFALMLLNIPQVLNKYLVELGGVFIYEGLNRCKTSNFFSLDPMFAEF